MRSVDRGTDRPGIQPRKSDGQLAFFGLANYQANPTSFNATVFINTPITVGQRREHLLRVPHQRHRAARFAERHRPHRRDGNGTWISASNASGGDTNITRVPHQAAPALSNDEQTLYVVVAGNSTAR